MGNILISFLGTNDYLECSYEHQGEIIKNVRFVQEATIRLNCTKWSETDRIVIFTTQQAFRANWQDNGHKDKRSGLGTRLNDLGLNCPIRQVHIPEGKNESEIWEIFSTVFDQIDQDDEIIFDITHAFRSIPILAMVILNYAKTLRNASLQGLYYGAMEALGNFSDVQKMERGKRIVPIFDLTSFNYLMEWSESIDQFIKSGNSTGVSRLAAKSARTILSQTKGRERSQHTIRTFANNLEAFTKTLSACRGRDISANVIRLKQNIEACQEINLNSSLNKPLQPLFEKISEQLDEFPENNIKGGVQAAQWCLDNNLIQQGYTILQETLISYFASGIDQNAESYETNRLLRELAGQTVYIFLKQQPEKNWPNKSKENKKIVDNYLTFFKTINMDLLKIFRDLSDFRNDINHCGHNKHPRPAMKFESSLGEFIEKTKLVL